MVAWKKTARDRQVSPTTRRWQPHRLALHCPRHQQNRTQGDKNLYDPPTKALSDSSIRPKMLLTYIVPEPLRTGAPWLWRRPPRRRLEGCGTANAPSLPDPELDTRTKQCASAVVFGYNPWSAYTGALQALSREFHNSDELYTYK